MSAGTAEWQGYRRVRAHVCGDLRIDGQPVTVGLVLHWRHQQTSATIAPSLRGRTLACLQRPHDRLIPAWVDDICASTWGRQCPFLAREVA